MIYEASEYFFKPPPLISRARRVLIKPNATHPYPYPISTSRDTLGAIINSIKRISDADIIILEGTPTGDPIYPIYKELGYDFPRVLMLDVKDCIWVEVENPLPHPFAVSTFWVPNVVISSDYLISVSTFKVFAGKGLFSIKNLLSLLPVSKYRSEGGVGWDMLDELGMDRVIADLYFTLPFDFGIIDARHKFISDSDISRGKIEQYGKTFAGAPFEIDKEASQIDKLDLGYLKLIESGKTDLNNSK